MAEAAQKVMEKRLKILRESRTGKKGSITKRINQLYQYVAEKEGRRATELLLKYLHKVYEELEKVCCEISELSDEYDGLNDLEDIRFEIETCEATVTEYLEEQFKNPCINRNVYVYFHIGRSLGLSFKMLQGGRVLVFGCSVTNSGYHAQVEGD